MSATVSLPIGMTDSGVLSAKSVKELSAIMWSILIIWVKPCNANVHAI